MLRRVFVTILLTAALFVTTMIVEIPALAQDGEMVTSVHRNFHQSTASVPAQDVPTLQVTETATPQVVDNDSNGETQEGGQQATPARTPEPLPTPDTILDVESLETSTAAPPPPTIKNDEQTGVSEVAPSVDASLAVSLSLANPLNLSGLELPIGFVSTTQTVTLVLENLSPVAEPRAIRLYTQTVAPGAYDPYTITFSAENVPYRGSDVQVVLYSTFTNTGLITKTTQLNVSEPIVVFNVSPVQTGDGTSLLIDHLVISRPFTPTVYPTSNNASVGYDLNNSLTKMPSLQPNRYSNYRITLPALVQDQQLFIGMVEDSLTDLAGPPQGVLLHVIPVIQSSNFLSPTQIGDGSIITMAGLTVTQAVSVELLSTVGNETEATVIVTETVRPGNHGLIELPIPIAARPLTSTSYLLRIIGTDPVTTVWEAPIELKLLPVLNSVIRDYQLTDGKTLNAKELHLGQPVTVTLSSDVKGGPADDDFAVFPLSPGIYRNQVLTIPEEMQPFTTTVFWVGFQSFQGLPVPESVRVEAVIRNGTSPKDIVFDVDTTQSGDGTALEVQTIKAFDPITVTVYTDINGKANLTDLAGQALLTGTSYVNERIELIADHQPITDTVFWLVSTSEKDTEKQIEKRVEYDFDPRSVLQELEIESPQDSNGREIEIAAIRATRPITMLLASSKTITDATPLLQMMVLEPGSRENFNVPILDGRQPVSNTIIWVHVVTPSGLPPIQQKRVNLLVNKAVEPQVAVADKITVRDQDSSGYSVVFDEVSAKDGGWLLVYRGDDSVASDLVGFAQVPKGKTSGFQFAFTDGPLAQGTVLNGVLHKDTGRLGVMDFPSADPPIIGKDGAVSASFVLGAPAVRAFDQTTFGDSVRVEQVISPQNGWIVVYDDVTSDVLGHLPVARGTSSDLVIPLATQVFTGEMPLNIMLHTDAGAADTFEFPSPDSVVIYNGAMVSKQISATVALRPASVNGIFSGDYVRFIQSRIVIDRVVTPQDAWLVLFCSNQDTKDMYCGHTRVLAGEHTDVEVALMPQGQVDSKVRAVLYEDLGVINALELDGPDVPLLVNGAKLETTVELPPPSEASPETGIGFSGGILHNTLLSLASVVIPLLLVGLNRFV